MVMVVIWKGSSLLILVPIIFLKHFYGEILQMKKNKNKIASSKTIFSQSIKLSPSGQYANN